MDMFILTEQEILDAIKNCHDADFMMALIRMLIPPAPIVKHRHCCPGCNGEGNKTCGICHGMGVVYLYW